MTKYEEKLIKNANYYRTKIQTDKGFQEQEKTRIRQYKKSRYDTDPEYRALMIKRAKDYYAKKKMI
jgi:hypothetical protein